jgi:hypothetical protein
MLNDASAMPYQSVMAAKSWLWEYQNLASGARVAKGFCGFALRKNSIKLPQTFNDATG